MLGRFYCRHCGQEWPEPGDRSGFGAAYQHAMKKDGWGAAHPGEPDPGPKDLAFVTPEGELIEGLKAAQRAAEDLGMVRSANTAAKAARRAGTGDEPLEDRLAKESVHRSDGMRGTPQTTTRGSPLAVDFKGLTLHLPPYLYAYFAMGIKRTVRPDTGEPYPFDAQGIADYVVDFLRYGHEARLPQFLEMSAADVDTAQGRRVLAATIAAIEGLTGEELAQSVAHILEAPETLPA